jgi:two-component system, LytTR family, response regulator
MTNLRVIIADDERPAREFLKRILNTFRDVSILGEAENGTEAVKMIRSLKPDLALLDLEMPQVSGLEVVRLLSNEDMPMVAFVTAYDEFAVQAFELNAVDYLLKPVEKTRLRETLDRAAKRLERSGWQQETAEQVRNAADNYDQVSRSEPLERIPVRKQESIFLVPVGEVASIVADGELLHITTRDNQRYTINYRLKDLESRLDERTFVRLSRAALVNLDMIARASPMPGGTYEISLKNGQELMTSRLQSRVLRGKLLRL